MSMLSRLRRLFTIKTRFEAYLVIYAIALGAVERGQHYLAMYPGLGGQILAVACTGVVFMAGAHLLDSVRPKALAVPAMVAERSRPRHGARRVTRRPRSRPTQSGSVTAVNRRTD